MEPEHAFGLSDLEDELSDSEVVGAAPRSGAFTLGASSYRVDDEDFDSGSDDSFGDAYAQLRRAGEEEIPAEAEILMKEKGLLTKEEILAKMAEMARVDVGRLTISKVATTDEVELHIADDPDDRAAAVALRCAVQGVDGDARQLVKMCSGNPAQLRSVAALCKKKGVAAARRFLEACKAERRYAKLPAAGAEYGTLFDALGGTLAALGALLAVGARGRRG